MKHRKMYGIHSNSELIYHLKYQTVKFKSVLVLSLFCLFFQVSNGQSSNIKWSLVLDGYNDVYLADLAIDSNGFTYAAINYTSNLKIPVLNKKLPYAKHVHGLILKINKQGKPIWAQPFTSHFDNRIRDIDIAPNGDLLITGFGDGIVCFPGQKDTVRVGIDGRRKQGIYAARYSPDGEPLWVQYWNCPWGEGLSISANSRNEVYMSFYFSGKIKHNARLLDSIPYSTQMRDKICLAKFDTRGNLLKIQTLGYQKNSTSILSARIKFDLEDNMILYGIFKGKINFTENDSLVNDSYMESTDSYIAKYSADETFLWSKKIGGQNYQQIMDLVIAPDRSIYATGKYNFECILGNGISVIQKSKYEWKSGSSFFYLHLTQEGELDFMRCEDNNGYSSHFSGQSIALGPNHKIHILGSFNDTLTLDHLQIQGAHHYQTALYSAWNGERLTYLEKIGHSSKSWIMAIKMAIDKNNFVSGCEYYGDSASLQINNKPMILSNKDYGRSCVIYGGSIPVEPKVDSVDLSIASIDTIRKNRMELIKPLLTCEKTNEDSVSNLWFPKNNEPELLKSTLKNSPCGIEVKGMEVSIFPNPTPGKLNIKVTGMDGLVQLAVLTDNGQIILSHRMEEVLEEQTITLDLSRLNSGTYFLSLVNKKYEKAFKFIKID